MWYMRTVEWDAQHCQVRLIDQRILPARFEVVALDDYHQVAEAIRNMTVRGAPAIGATAAFGLALAACRYKGNNLSELKAELPRAEAVLRAARPTAVNLGWALDMMLKVVADADGTADTLRQRLVAEAQRIADEDVATNLSNRGLGHRPGRHPHGAPDGQTHPRAGG